MTSALWLCLSLTLFGEVSFAIQERSLPSLPDAHGLAGPFAGLSHGTLLVAGGANFPDKKPWDGGQKVWHDPIYALEHPTGTWRQVGRLPRRLAYGVSVTYRDAVVCVGGCDANEHVTTAFRMEWIDKQIQISELPALPAPIAYAAGALVGDILYITGGQSAPAASNALHSVWCLNLADDDARWQAIAAWPGRARMLAMAASFDNAFWLFGGVDLEPVDSGTPKRVYLNDVYCYRTNHGWQRMADMPYPLAAAPSPAPVTSQAIVLLGGDDGTQVGQDASRHRGFNQSILLFDQTSRAWRTSGNLTSEPQVTVPCVPWDHSSQATTAWVVPSGEVRPGIRTPAVRWFEFDTKE